MSTLDLTAAIRDRLNSIGTAATTAAEALDSGGCGAGALDCQRCVGPEKVAHLS
jgi:hypothetical protein